LIRTIYLLWLFGFFALGLVATSQLVFGAADTPNRTQLWLGRMLLAAVWPIAMLSPAGRDRLRSRFTL
jgi:hypothetical protein